MRVLITGAGGQVGTDLVSAFAGHDVIACTRSDLDVGDRDACMQQIPVLSPEVVVHAAAYTDVDGCESNPDRAWRDNVLGSGHVAAAAHSCGAHLVCVSSDYVFSGDASEPYESYAPVSPVSVYGRSKAYGESAALLANPGSTAIVRSSWIYGVAGGNFVKTMLRLAASRDVVDVVDDQTGSPTWSWDLAGAIVALSSSRRTGIWHVTNAGATTWYAFAQEIFRLSGLDPSRVRPTSTEKLARPAPRPSYSVLSGRLWRLAGFTPLRSWQDALTEALPLISF